MEIDRDDSLKILEWDVRCLAVRDPGATGRVDQYVDPVTALQQFADSVVNRSLGGDVRFEGEHITDKLPGGRLESLGSKVDQCDRRPLREKSPGDRKSDSGCAAGDEYNRSWGGGHGSWAGG